MYIHNLTTEETDLSYFDENFQITVESHFPYLLSLPNTIKHPVESFQGLKYEGDFFGLLSDIGIPKKYHFIIMRLNGLRCPGDYQKDQLEIIVPDLNELDLLKSIYQATILN